METLRAVVQWSCNRSRDVLHWYMALIVLLPLLDSARWRALVELVAALLALADSLFGWPVPATACPVLHALQALDHGNGGGAIGHP